MCLCSESRGLPLVQRDRDDPGGEVSRVQGSGSEPGSVGFWAGRRARAAGWLRSSQGDRAGFGKGELSAGSGEFWWSWGEGLQSTEVTAGGQGGHQGMRGLLPRVGRPRWWPSSDRCGQGCGVSTRAASGVRPAVLPAAGPRTRPARPFSPECPPGGLPHPSSRFWSRLRVPSCSGRSGARGFSGRSLWAFVYLGAAWALQPENQAPWQVCPEDWPKAALSRVCAGLRWSLDGAARRTERGMSTH